MTAQPTDGDDSPVTITEFLSARLDEDEAAAKARRGIYPSPGVEESGAVWLHVKRGGNAVVVHYAHPVEGYGDMADLRAWADADQGWTQARVLREVAAKRAILRYFTTPEGTPVAIGIADTPEELGRGEVTALPGSWVLREIAAVWSDHPDYDPAWRP